MFLTIFLVEAAILAFLFVYFVPMASSLLWLEIILGILSGIIVSFIIRLLHLWLIGLINSHYKPHNKFNVFYIKSVMGFVLFITRVRVKYEGLENIDNSKSYVIYSNHKSNLDFMYMLRPLKLKVGFLGKKELENTFLGKTYGKMLNCVFIDRSNDKEGAKAIIKTINNIKDGTSMIVYPEGTRTTEETNKMLEGHPGSYKIALKAKCDIIPVTCINSNKIGKNAPFRKTKVKVIFHKPITYDEYKDMQTIDLEKMIRDIINEPIEE